MGKKYIDVETLKDIIGHITWYRVGNKELLIGAKHDEEAVYKYTDIEQAIKNAPTADVTPVVHAYWDTVESEGFWVCNMEESLKTGKPTKVKLPVCSHCKTQFGTMAFEFKHCPNCGAKMKED